MEENREVTKDEIVEAGDVNLGTNDIGGETHTDEKSPRDTTNTTAITTPTAADSKKRKRDEDQDSDSGCDCRGSCLLYSCACFVQGRFCDPASCRCCGPASAKKDVPPSPSIPMKKTPLPCQNNDKEEYVQLRKERLLRAMQDHPDAFWNRESAASPTLPEPRMLAESLKQSETQDANHPGEPHLDSSIWESIQVLLKNRLDPSRHDAGKNINPLSSSSGLESIKVCIEKIIKHGGDDGFTPEDLAHTTLQMSSKHLLIAIEKMISAQGISWRGDIESQSEMRRNEVTSKSANAMGSDAHVRADSALLCSENFPEDIPVSNGSQYFHSLETKIASYTSTGNSNDPLVHNLMCQESGFFDGDDASVVTEEGETKPISSSQRVILIQQMTKMVRAQTLRLTQRRMTHD